MATEETTKRRAYQREYHKENRERNNERSINWYHETRQQVLSKHRERMANDSKYAEKMREKDRRNYAKRRDAAFSKQDAGMSQEKINVGRTPKGTPLYGEIDGKLIRVFPVSELARKIDCSSSVIYKWEQQGIIPKSVLHPHRLYTERQVKLIGYLVGIGRRNYEARANVSRLIYENWK